MTAYRGKLDSINETTIPALDALNERLDQTRSSPPKELDGEWSIIVRGPGPIPTEAQIFAARLVNDLRGAGLVVSHATVQHGAAVPVAVDAPIPKEPA